MQSTLLDAVAVAVASGDLPDTPEYWHLIDREWASYSCDFWLGPVSVKSRGAGEM